MGALHDGHGALIKSSKEHNQKTIVSIFINPKQFNNKEVNGYITKCVDVDCTDENSKVQNMISKYDIESYPTVKMVKDKNTIEFDSKITTNTLEHFVNTMLME